MGRRRRPKNATPRDEVDFILTDPRVVWFPVKHFSPVCAWHVRQLIHELQPAAVLIEGPDDATELIPWIVAEDTWAPLTVLSSHVDKKNEFELNGILSPSPEVPARYRGWWPLVPYSPEYQALVAGHEVGARLAFIDAPLRATIPYRHARERSGQSVVNDRHLAENAYFQALGARQRRRSFEDFWQANFEVGGFTTSTRDFMRAVLLFAWCARHVGDTTDEALEADGTLLREAHMRWWVDQIVKQIDAEAKDNPPPVPYSLEPRPIVVVTGAFHSVALPHTKRKRAKAKADRNTETLLTAHSFRALANLYEMGRLPQYFQLVWEHMQAAHEEPFNAASMQLLVEVMRAARDQGVGVSTADTVGAYRVARNLAVLRKNRQVTLDDLLDAVHMSYVKGDARLAGVDIQRATRSILIGQRIGRVTPEAGQAPLMRDYYDCCKTHRLDITGAKKVVRCDLHKQLKHRFKSAFLHQCDFLSVPMFASIDDGRGWRASGAHYKGPNLVSGENMHLIGETWGVRWNEQVDDRLLEVSDRGASIAASAASLLRDQLAGAKGNAADTTKLLLRCAQMMLLDVFDEVLEAVEDAVEVDASFDNLVTALGDFVVLHSYRDAVATQGHARLLGTIRTLFNKACLVLPGIAGSQDTDVRARLDHLQTLVRIAITFMPDVDGDGLGDYVLDTDLLIEKIREMVADIDGEPALRGAGFGVLFSFGATREKVVARELDGYLLGAPERVLQAGSFLEGLFLSSKSVFMGSPRLLRAINRVIGQLDWHTFKLLLPDLRRAFTQFIPTEIDDIARRVGEEVGLLEMPDPDEPVPEALVRLAAGADQRVATLLEDWV